MLKVFVGFFLYFFVFGFKFNNLSEVALCQAQLLGTS